MLSGREIFFPSETNVESSLRVILPGTAAAGLLGESYTSSYFPSEAVPQSSLVDFQHLHHTLAENVANLRPPERRLAGLECNESQ
jgi:hypothetical protein